MRSVFFLILFLSVKSVFCQVTQISLSSDTIKFSILRDGHYDGQKLYQFPIQANADQSPYTMGGKDVEFVFYGDKDTVRFVHTDYPKAQAFPVKIKSPNHEADIKVGFHSITAELPQAYMDEVRGKVIYEIPEVFELANIILGLSNSFQGASQNKETPYYKEVLTYFDDYSDHEIFDKLSTDGLQEKEEGDQYYDFRDNSYGYTFNDSSEIVHANQYFYLNGYNRDTHENMFAELLPLIQDFANKSDFRSFFRNHRGYYDSLMATQGKLLMAESMWQWLEKEFPVLKIHTYKVVMSPIIGGSHSTQMFHQRIVEENEVFSECMMFMNVTDRRIQDRYDSNEDLTAFISGNLFTELDHNYINPFTRRYYNEISSAFKDRSKWVAQDKATYYSSEHSVYQEYLTYALYSVWARETFSKEVADAAIAKRVELNENRRGFYRFTEFNDMLVKLENKHSDKTIMELMPQIIEWCQNID